jgi:hypothetical protein
MKKPRRKKGPKPEVLKLKTLVDWKAALKNALQKPKPTDGWPKVKLEK